MFVQSRLSGPIGNGLVIDEPSATNVALAECATGFGGLSVLVDECRYIVLPGLLCLHHDRPEYQSAPEPAPVRDRNDTARDCDREPDLLLGHTDPVHRTSFSAVKSLYQQD